MATDVTGRASDPPIGAAGSSALHLPGFEDRCHGVLGIRRQPLPFSGPVAEPNAGRVAREASAMSDYIVILL